MRLVAILSQLISVDFRSRVKISNHRPVVYEYWVCFLVTESDKLESELNEPEKCSLSKGMRIYIFETNNLSAYYAQSNNSTHDLTIKVFCILHQTYLFVHSVENGSKVISPGT